jgi:hypothetical protein
MNIDVQGIDKQFNYKFKYIVTKHITYLTLEYVFTKVNERILFISGLKYKCHNTYPDYFKVYIHNIKEYEKCIRILQLINKNCIYIYNKDEVINFFEGK